MGLSKLPHMYGEARRQHLPEQYREKGRVNREKEKTGRQLTVSAGFWVGEGDIDTRDKS